MQWKSWLMVGSLIAVALTIAVASVAHEATDAKVGPVFQSIGPLTFGPGGVLFAADTEASTVFALELGSPQGAVAGIADVSAIDQKIAALLGTDVHEISVTDLAIHPESRNAFISVMRGQGARSIPVLVRVDGAGEIEVVRLENVGYSEMKFPNPPAPNPRRDPEPSWARDMARTESITDMAYVDGELFVAGLSNEEFASKLRSVSYPFSGMESSTSVEIFHGNHGRLETRSPVYAFLPYMIDNTQHLIAAYLCTPLVTFPVSSLEPGKKVLGKTIAELGSRNRPLDMIQYRKNGKDFLLISNTSLAVMKVPTDRFASAMPITEPVEGETAGIGAEAITALTGIEQLDRLDGERAAVMARAELGDLNLLSVPLP